MRVRFYLMAIAVVIAAAFLVDHFLGKLYVRYMILFSGALFLWGMAVGQRSEQAWMRRRAKTTVAARAQLRTVSANQEGKR